MKKAIVLGATGMVGTALVQQLIKNDFYVAIKLFVRRATDLKHPKLQEFVVDFDKPSEWEHLVTGTVLYSTLGTTLAVAGSKANQFKVDFTYQYQMAQIAAKNGVESYVLVSSTGAKASAANFYLSMKGQLDEAVQQLAFKYIVILRPGQLYGNRLQKRVAEKWAIKLMFLINKLGLLKKYRPIHADEVARAMINSEALSKSAVITLDELFLV